MQLTKGSLVRRAQARRFSSRPSALLIGGALLVATPARAQVPSGEAPPGAPVERPPVVTDVAPPPPPDTPPPAAAPAPASAWTFTPSAQVRLRGESRVNGYSPAVRDDEYFITSRVRVGLGVTWQRLRLMVQAQDIRNLGDTLPGNDGGDRLGLHQGFAEVGFEGGYFRVGRQEINYGSERFLGALDWLSQARSFDGARVHYAPNASFEFDVFGAIVRGETAFMDGATRKTTVGDYFGAAQAAYLASPALRLEANYFVRHDGATAALPTRDRTIHAPTLRLSGNVSEGLVRYDLEATVQVGESNGQDHFAYGAAGDVFVRLGPNGRPTLDGGFSYATGASADGDVDELENFFPTNHKLYGYMDLFGLRNVISGHVGVTHRFADANVIVGARGWQALLQTTNPSARWSNATGATLGTGQSGSRHLGTEADFWVNYKPWPFASITGGYSLFAPGAGAEAMGRDETQHWIWLQLDVFTP